MKSNLKSLIVWMVIAYTICLVPGPEVWDEGLKREVNKPAAPKQTVAPKPSVVSAGEAKPSGSPKPVVDQPDKSLPKDTPSASPVESATLKAVNSFLTENVKPKERLGHMIPMIGVAFCLVRLLRRRHTGRADSPSAPQGRRKLLAVRAQLPVGTSLKTKNLKLETGFYSEKDVVDLQGKRDAGDTESGSLNISDLKLKTAAMLLSLVAVFGIALSIELLQELLPEWFHRGFAWDDISMAMFGGLLGAGAALAVQVTDSKF